MVYVLYRCIKNNLKEIFWCREMWCYFKMWWLCILACVSPKPLPFLDSQITDTGHYSDFTARLARLDDSTGWISPAGTPGSLLVDYLQRTTITGIKARGANVYSVWSSYYTVQYSNDGKKFENYREHGNTKVSKTIILPGKSSPGHRNKTTISVRFMMLRCIVVFSTD